MLKRKNTRLLIVALIVIGFVILILFYKNQILLFLKNYPKTHPSSININYESNDNDIEDIVRDLNIYLTQKNEPKVTPQVIPEIKNHDLFEKLESGKVDFIVIDVREDLELSSNHLPLKYSNIQYIRLGDLINNAFKGLDKNNEIIVLSFGKTRAYAAALFLKSNNFTNVKLLEGGILKWAKDNLPMEINNYTSNQTISAYLKRIKPEDMETAKTKVLSFGPASQTQNIQPVFWDTQTLNNYINSLSREDSYILSCNTIKYCYDALYFWYEAKKSIKIIGYTGI